MSNETKSINSSIVKSGKNFAHRKGHETLVKCYVLRATSTSNISHRSSCKRSKVFLPEEVPRVTDKMVARIAKERMVMESWIVKS